MIIEREVDCGAIYRAQRQALIARARELTDAQLRTTVAATPAWDVHDVIAHVVGIAADLNAGKLGGDPDDPDAWTGAQVAARRGASVDELAEEWDREGPRFEEGLRLLGYEIGSHFLGDLLQHVQDVRAALGDAHFADDEALQVGLDFYLDRFHESLIAARVGAVAVRSTPESEVVVGAGDVIAGVTASRFELFRALGGRRSARQVRALAWTGDVDAVLALVSAYPMPVSDQDDG